MITATAFVLAVPNLEISAAYYRDVLGFTIHDISDPGWKFYRKDACLIHAGECADAIPPADLGDHSYFAYLMVDDIDAYYAEVKAKGAKILKPLRDEPWGRREFALRTVDGHRIMFAMDLKRADE